jgi:hypothetical protein
MNLQLSPIGRNTSLAAEEMAAKAALGEGLNSFETMVEEKEANVITLDSSPVIFVYEKDGTFRALNFEEAKEREPQIKVEGWKHIDTLNAKVFIANAYLQERKALQNYERAEKLLDGCGWYASGDYSDTAYQALRIAAGLE